MLISSEKLLNLPVQTQSGQDLGQVSSFDIDTDTQAILKYHVKSSNPITNIIKQKELLITSSQVIEITSEKMIVDDNLIPQTTPAPQPASA